MADKQGRAAQDLAASNRTRRSNEGRNVMTIGEDIAHARASGRLTRRHFSKLAAALGVGVVTLPGLARPARAAGEITYYGWAGYDDANFNKGYTEKYGGAPNYSFWGS